MNATSRQPLLAIIVLVLGACAAFARSGYLDRLAARIAAPATTVEELATCMNRYSGMSNAEIYGGLYYANYWGDLSDAPIIDGRIGWHVTWAIAVDESGDRLAFYETYQEQSGLRILFREQLPLRVQRSAEACGASYEGVLQSDNPLWAQLYGEDPLLLGDDPLFDDLPIEGMLPPI